MSTNPADGPILGTLYGSDAMRAVFDERAYFQRMLDVEAALARVQARLGIIPADAAAAIIAAARSRRTSIPRNSPPARAMSAIRWSGWSAACRAPPGQAGAWTHWGATTQDIMDTATVLQVREGLGLIETELLAVLRALTAQARPPPRHGDGRPHPSATGAADQLRPEMRRLGAAVHRATSSASTSFARAWSKSSSRGAAGTLASLGDQGIAVMEALAAELGPAARRRPLACLPRQRWPKPSASSASSAAAWPRSPPTSSCCAQTEVGEVAEPYVAGRGASSTMPQKRNPIASEYMLAAARVACRRWCR